MHMYAMYVISSFRTFSLLKDGKCKYDAYVVQKHCEYDLQY